MSDQKFPLISYFKNGTPISWGRMHGESFREGIRELCAIRKDLVLSKNSAILKNLKSHALAQFEITKKYSQDLADELSAIAEGAGTSLDEIVILNNYTDIKDMDSIDEGCSTIHFQKGKKEVCAGQTWDMHGSAKNYCAILKVPSKEETPAMLLFTLVGCVGMMGINSHFLLTAINNINTKQAKNGVIWPVVVRQILKQKTLKQMKDTLLNTPVTSGHNYMLSDKKQAQHWEITPYKYQKVSHLNQNQNGVIFHTNHCLGDSIQPLEIIKNISTTSKTRYSLLAKKTPSLKSFSDLKSLLKNHDNYPRSICVHALEGQGLKDPSLTCGGGVAHLIKENIHFWRGCEKYDSHYIDYDFTWDRDTMDFKKV